MADLAPSILSADMRVLGEEIKKTVDAGARMIHFDVMDGMFVPNISFGPNVLKAVRKCTDVPVDAHLMVQEPVRYIKAFRDAGADIITVHVEACGDLDGTLKALKELAEGPGRPLKYGIVLNPETPAEEAYPYIDDVYMVLIMGVHPGFGGQKFIPETLEKIRTLRRHIDEKGSKCLIEVDGGVNMANAADIAAAGADIIVAGNAVFSGDAAENTAELVKRINS